jgi:hypothetical protein
MQVSHGFGSGSRQHTQPASSSIAIAITMMLGLMTIRVTSAQDSLSAHTLHAFSSSRSTRRMRQNQINRNNQNCFASR